MAEMVGPNGKFYASDFVEIAIPRATVIALRPDARRLDTSAERLIRALVDVIATEHLVMAVLDDEGVPEIAVANDHGGIADDVVLARRRRSNLSRPGGLPRPVLKRGRIKTA